jgi:hypothetical protein
MAKMGPSGSRRAPPQVTRASMTRASRPLSRYNDMLNVFRHASRQGVEIKMESGDLVQKKKKIKLCVLCSGGMESSSRSAVKSTDNNGLSSDWKCITPCRAWPGQGWVLPPCKLGIWAVRLLRSAVEKWGVSQRARAFHGFLEALIICQRTFCWSHKDHGWA